MKTDNMTDNMTKSSRMKILNQQIADLHPCKEAVKWWLGQPSDQAAWAACERGDWMLWLLAQGAGPVDGERHRKLTAAKAACARLVLDIFETACPGDLRPRLAIEAAERYAGGERYAASAASASAASAAAFAASAAAFAASAAASAAAFAASAAASSAASSASSAAAAAAAAADAADAYRQMLTRCADKVREVFPSFPLALAKAEGGIRTAV